MVGKLITPSGTLPFLLPIHQTDDGELFIDTCLTTTAEASIVLALRVLILWFMHRCPQRWSSYGKFCRKTTAELCIWLSAARSTLKPKATANISFIYRAVMSSSLKRRVFVEW
ncbi:hypothetical protein DMI70_01775 [Escherichia coli]|nr:hypothetical protein [Escherichia coli]